MAKVIVECEGERHEFEGSYVIGFAIDASDKEHAAVDGIHCGEGYIDNKVLALGGIVRSILDNLAEGDFSMHAALCSLFLEELFNYEESEENKDVDESNI